MLLVQVDSILWKHLFPQVLPHMSVSYFFVLLMSLNNTLRRILISMLIRKFLAGTLGDSLLPNINNKMCPDWDIRLNYKDGHMEMLVKKINASPLFHVPLPHFSCSASALESKCLHKSSQAVASQAASSNCWSFSSFSLLRTQMQTQDWELWKVDFKHLLAIWDLVSLHSSDGYGNISNGCRLWVMHKMCKVRLWNTVCSSALQFLADVRPLPFLFPLISLSWKISGINWYKAPNFQYCFKWVRLSCPTSN